MREKQTISQKMTKIKLWSFKNTCNIKVGWGLGEIICEIIVAFILTSWNYVYIASCCFIYSQATITCSEAAVEELVRGVG